MLLMLERTRAFPHLPAMSRPSVTLWNAYTDALLQIRQPLYHQLLKKKPPAGAAQLRAIRCGLALVASYAVTVKVQRAIIRITNAEVDAISFQPRPHGANWVRRYGLAPRELWSPRTDPMSADAFSRGDPTFETGDVLSLAGKLAQIAARYPGGAEVRQAARNGTMTWSFRLDADDAPCATGVYNSYPKGLDKFQIDFSPLGLTMHADRAATTVF